MVLSVSISITIQKKLMLIVGKLTVIVGAVGSGKSSLLQAIMGEMTTLTGRVIKNRYGNYEASVIYNALNT